MLDMSDKLSPLSFSVDEGEEEGSEEDADTEDIQEDEEDEQHQQQGSEEDKEQEVDSDLSQVLDHRMVVKVSRSLQTVWEVRNGNQPFCGTFSGQCTKLSGS